MATFVEKTQGLNVYFTLLDGVKSDSLGNNRLKLERLLKIHLLTKKRIVIAASHLTNKSAFDLFCNSKNADNKLEDRRFLLSEGLITVALNTRYESYEHLYKDKFPHDKKNDHIRDFFQNNIKQILPYRLEDSADLFLQTLEKDCEDESSHIRKILRRRFNKGIELKFIELILRVINEAKNSNTFLSRELLNKKIENTFADNAKNVIKSYIDYLYYRLGANSVACENNIPLNNYLDLSKTLFTEYQEQLTDDAIFIDMVMKMILGCYRKLSLLSSQTLLDEIRFRDIVELRKRNKLLTEKFQEKYNECKNIAFNITNIKDRDFLLNEIDKIKSLANNISEEYRKSIIKELPTFQKVQNVKKFANFGKKLMFTGIDVLDVASNITGADLLDKTVESSSAIFDNTYEYSENTNFVQKFKNKVDSTFKYYINKLYKNDAILLLYLHELVEIYLEDINVPNMIPQKQY